MKQANPSAGFTLIEVMVATAVSAIVASVAYPAFTGSVQKIRRADALVAVMQVQQAQERWRSNSHAYATLPELALPAAVAGGNYVLSVDRPSATGYEVLASAAGAQAGDRQCRYMKLSVDAGNFNYRSGRTAAADNDAQANRQCWNL